MKKYLFCLVILLLVITGCNNSVKTNNKVENNKDQVKVVKSENKIPRVANHETGA